MQLDELKQSWAAHGAVLERSLAIDERLLREVLLRKVRFALAPYLLWRALEVAICIAVLVAVVAVLGAHIAEPRYFVVAGTVAVFSFVITALNGYLLVSGLRLDYEGPVTAIRRDIERIKLAEYRALKWALLGGVMLWLPVLLVLFEALTSVAALARVNLAYLVANLFFGLVVLALGQMLSRKYVERPDIGPRTRRLVEAISGRALRTAAGNLADLARFEREDESETA